jgi:hopene-associated glycosyltransferase HpnB
MLILGGVLSLSIWLYLFFAQGRFWRLGTLVESTSQIGEVEARVAAIIPARDEADVVGRCVESLLNQAKVPALRLFLVDDGSSDGTAEAAHKAAQSAGGLERLLIIQARPLAPGWSGKLWAVQQGLEEARKLNPDFFLLTDADIVHAPDSVATLVKVATDGAFDLASFMVKLHCETLAERALIPAFVFFFLKLYPPAWISDRRRRTAGAAGGSILIRPEALARAGGIEAIRREVIDDCALARKVKQTGGSVWLGLAAKTKSIRPYATFSAIGRMISRGAFNQLQHSPLLLLLALVGLSVTYLLPPALLIISRHWMPAVMGGTAWLLMSVCFLPTVRLYRLNLLWAAALPAIALFYMGATIHSAVKFWTGRGGQWKGRVQDPARS